MPDPGIGGHEGGFCLENIRPTPQQLRGEAHGDLRLNDHGPQRFRLQEDRAGRGPGQNLHAVQFHSAQASQIRILSGTFRHEESCPSFAVKSPKAVAKPTPTP